MEQSPSLESIKTQDWCKRDFPRFWSKEMWPPASPDLNPMDFSVCFTLKSNVSCVANTSVDVVKTLLLRKWVKILQKTLRASAGNFRKIIKLLI